jgi:hypothetical protein
MSRGVIKGAADQPEDGSFQEQSAGELGVSNLPVLGFRRFLVIDQAPHLLEDLLSDHPREETADDADWQEQQFHGSVHRALCGRARRRGVAVLSVAPMNLARAAYHERSLGHGLDDYYSEWGERPGLWWGGGAELLGLEGYEQTRFNTAAAEQRTVGSIYNSIYFHSSDVSLNEFYPAI